MKKLTQRVRELYDSVALEHGSDFAMVAVAAIAVAFCCVAILILF